MSEIESEPARYFPPCFLPSDPSLTPLSGEPASISQTNLLPRLFLLRVPYHSSREKTRMTNTGLQNGSHIPLAHQDLTQIVYNSGYFKFLSFCSRDDLMCWCPEDAGLLQAGFAGNPAPGTWHMLPSPQSCAPSFMLPFAVAVTLIMWVVSGS